MLEANFVENTREISCLLKLGNLGAAPGKMIIGIKEIAFMGWNWKTGILSPSAHKLSPILVCEKLHTIKGLSSFFSG